MSYDNPIVGFVHKFGAWSGVNVILKDGRQSNLPLKNGGGKGYQSSTIPLNTHVKTVMMKGDKEFGGCIFYDKTTKKVLECGHLSTLCSREFVLKDNERLVGIQASLLRLPLSPRMEDLVFIIGYLE